jgi:hypothetical protein
MKRVLCVTLLVLFGILAQAQEPFMDITITVDDCPECTVEILRENSGGHWDKLPNIKPLICDKNPECDFRFYDASPRSEYIIKITNEENQHQMEVFVKAKFCLNSKLDLLNIPFKGGLYEPLMHRDGCTYSISDDYDWQPVILVE